MFSDVSSLTDFSTTEESETYQPTKKKNTKKSDYVLKGALRAPRTVNFSASSLYGQIIDEAVNLSPEYQRDVVWTESKQIGLIDSLLRNFYIPPVIFALSMSDDGHERRRCIDGKQRLTSIVRFMNGEIPHKDSRTGVKLWYKVTQSNPKGKELPQQYKQQFANKQIVCVEYEGLNDDAEREIFQRVQLGVALTPAERMQAASSPWAGLVREIQGLVNDEEKGFRGKLEWSSGRGRDFQCLATAIYLIEKWPGRTMPGATTLDKWLIRVTPPSKSFRESTIEAFDVLLALVSDKKHGAVFSKPRIAPIELIMCILLIKVKMHELSLSQLSSAIRLLRDDVRAVHEDIRTNSKVAKTMFTFLLDNFPVYKLKSDGAGDKPALEFVKARPKTGTNGAASQASKRKRAVTSMTSSEEDDVPLRRTTSSPIKKAARTVSGVPSSPMKDEGSRPTEARETPSRTNSTNNKQPHASSSQANSRIQSPLSQTISHPISTAPKVPNTMNSAFASMPTVHDERSAVAPTTSDRLSAIRRAKAYVASPSGTPSPTGLAAPKGLPTRDPLRAPNPSDGAVTPSPGATPTTPTQALLVAESTQEGISAERLEMIKRLVEQQGPPGPSQGQNVQQQPAAQPSGLPGPAGSSRQPLPPLPFTFNPPPNVTHAQQPPSRSQTPQQHHFHNPRDPRVVGRTQSQPVPQSPTSSRWGGGGPNGAGFDRAPQRNNSFSGPSGPYNGVPASSGAGAGSGSPGRSPQGSRFGPPLATSPASLGQNGHAQGQGYGQSRYREQGGSGGGGGGAR